MKVYHVNGLESRKSEGGKDGPDDRDNPKKGKNIFKKLVSREENFQNQNVNVKEGKQKKGEDYLRIITINIMSGHNNRLEAVCLTLHKMGADIGILTETKFNNDKYTQNCFGYEIIATKAISSQKGGVAICVKKESKHWHVEGTRTYGPNVINTIIVSGQDRWNLIGAYVSPNKNTGETIAEISKAANRNTHRIIFAGDLNTDLENIQSDRDAEIAAMMTNLGAVDLAQHFVQEKGRWTWRMKRRELISQASLTISLYNGEMNGRIAKSFTQRD